jgi:hypothetical protein
MNTEGWKLNPAWETATHYVGFLTLQGFICEAPLPFGLLGPGNPDPDEPDEVGDDPGFPV